MDEGVQADDNLPGTGGETTNPSTNAETQSTADAAESQADSTEPAVEVGDIDGAGATGEGEQDGDVEPLPASESEPEEGGLEEPLSFAQGAASRHPPHGTVIIVPMDD